MPPLPLGEGNRSRSPRAVTFEVCERRRRFRLFCGCWLQTWRRKTVQHRKDCFPQKGHHIHAPTAASCHLCPKTFVPFIPGTTSNALCDQPNIVITLTLFAPIHQLVIFGNGKWFFDEFDLLKGLGFGAVQIELMSALGTGRKFELDDFVYQFR